MEIIPSFNVHTSIIQTSLLDSSSMRPRRLFDPVHIFLLSTTQGLWYLSEYFFISGKISRKFHYGSSLLINY